MIGRCPLLAQTLSVFLRTAHNMKLASLRFKKGGFRHSAYMRVAILYYCYYLPSPPRAVNPTLKRTERLSLQIWSTPSRCRQNTGRCHCEPLNHLFPPCTDFVSSYVILTATLSTVVAQWHNVHVFRYRRDAKVACTDHSSFYITLNRS